MTNGAEKGLRAVCTRSKHRRDTAVSPVFLFLLSQSLFQRLCDLIRTGSGLTAAAQPLHALDGILCIHPDKQRTDALQIAVAAAYDLDINNLVVFVQSDLSTGRANTLIFAQISHF